MADGKRRPGIWERLFGRQDPGPQAREAPEARPACSAPVNPVFPKVRGEIFTPMNLVLFSSQPRAVQASLAVEYLLAEPAAKAFSLTIFKMPAGATRWPSALTPSFKIICTKFSKSGTQLNMPALPTGNSFRNTQALSS